MRARRVSKLDPDGTLAENLRRTVEVRLRELESFVPRALDPDEREAQHDMRIAAKRLRYVLDLSVPVFGEPAAKGAKAARRLQEVLGELHDCDELLPRARAHVKGLRAQDATALRGAAGRSRDLDPALVRDAPNRLRYRGLESLIAYLMARRGLLFERFVREWGGLERKAFGETLLAGLAPARPEVSAAERSRAAPADAGAA